MSYFAKPNFITYDDWFDEDLEKHKLDFKHKKIKTISNIHEFFYEKSNYKIGASENNLRPGIKVNEKVINNSFFEKTSKEVSLISNKKSQFFKKFDQSKNKLYIKNKLIYSLSIFGFALILGFLLFFISQAKDNESNLMNKSSYQEKEL